MTALINLPRAAWKRQPQVPVGISPYWRNGLVADYELGLGHYSRELITATQQIVPNLETTKVGVSAKFSGLGVSTGKTALGKYSTFASGSVSWSVMMLVRKSSPIGTGTFFSKAQDTNALRVFQVVNTNEAGSPYIYLRGNQTDANLGHNDVLWHLYTVVYSNNAAVFYADNKQVSAVIGTASNDATSYFIGSRTATYGYPLTGNVAFVRYWEDRSITQAEHLGMMNNPWQLFTPAPSRFYLIPGSGGATTYDVALTLAYTAAFQPTATAQFNAGITLATLAGALSGKNAQFNTALTLDTNVSVTLQRALSALATVQLDMTAGQSVSALNAAVAAITESIACAYTSSVTANLLAGLSLAISQGLLASTGATLQESLTLALNAALTPSVQASYATQLSLLATLQTALTTALSTSATLTLPAIFTVTIDGEKLGNNDLALALHVQTGISTSATAILSAQLTLATQLLATPAGVGSFQTALTLANQLSALFTTGSELSSSLSLAVSLALADAAAISMGGALELGAVLSQVQIAIASFQAGLTFPTTLTAPITGGLAMEEGISLGWTLGTNLDGTFFEITVTLPTGRMVVITASERLISIQASERLVQLLPTNPFVQV